MKQLILLIFITICTLNASAQWNNNSSVNNVLVQTPRLDYNRVSVPDGANGAINVIVGQNIGQNATANIYAQKISDAGIVAWGDSSTPVLVCSTQETDIEVSAVSDGNGGIYIAWSDFRNTPGKGDIYVQKIGSSGDVQWTANGLRLTNISTRHDVKPRLCQDGAGGLIITWGGDDPTTKNSQCYAQRLNSSGTALWMANGVQVCSAAGFRIPGFISIVSDYNNGAIISFMDTRNDVKGLDFDFGRDSLTNVDIYAQRLNGNGVPLWTGNGVAVSTAPGHQIVSPIAVTDGNGGAIIMINDGRNDHGDSTENDAYIQLINSEGVAMWPVNGVPIATAIGFDNIYDACPDGSGGIIAAFSNVNNLVLKCQRINSAGTITWTPGGIAVADSISYQSFAAITADASGNAIVAYSLSDTNSTAFTTWAQKISVGGSLLWGNNGVLVNDGGSSGANFSTLLNLSDNGSVIVSWNNFAGIQTLIDVLVSKVLANGQLAGDAAISYTSASNGNWDNPGTWANNLVPPAGATIIIKHNIVANINANCHSISVQFPGILTVNTGINITILY